jgi:signal transduction histidine kinase
MVLHDLRSPLSAIISSIYLAINILQAPDETDTVESVIPTLQISLESAGHLVQMVETLRDLPVLAEMTITPSQATLKELATEAINSLASTLKEANIEVIYRLPADLPALWVDTDLVRRVFINLLHNAFKFTPVNGSIMIYASTENAPAGYLYVSISDTGPGIPDSQRERIFQEFVQIEGRRPRAGGRGIGLGLNFCKLAVEAHGGRIWVEQQSPLSGACFAFYLPYQQQSNGH